jgi:hypothetical protein
MARPAFATAPVVKRSSSSPEACHIPSSRGICCRNPASVKVENIIKPTLTGFGDEKKSINRPIVNGTLSDTAADISSNPIAINSGFFSGFAKATILENDEMPCGLFEKILDNIDEGRCVDCDSGVFVISAALS